MNKRRKFRGYLFFFPFLLPLLFGATIAGVGPIQTQGSPTGSCSPGSTDGACLCQQGHWICYKE
jgi:hypothetical protein